MVLLVYIRERDIKGKEGYKEFVFLKKKKSKKKLVSEEVGEEPKVISFGFISLFTLNYRFRQIVVLNGQYACFNNNLMD